jgi:hypothetical protein
LNSKGKGVRKKNHKARPNHKVILSKKSTLPPPNFIFSSILDPLLSYAPRGHNFLKSNGKGAMKKNHEKYECVQITMC